MIGFLDVKRCWDSSPLYPVNNEFLPPKPKVLRHTVSILTLATKEANSPQNVMRVNFCKLVRSVTLTTKLRNAAKTKRHFLKSFHVKHVMTFLCLCNSCSFLAPRNLSSREKKPSDISGASKGTGSAVDDHWTLKIFGEKTLRDIYCIHMYQMYTYCMKKEEKTRQEEAKTI